MVVWLLLIVTIVTSYFIQRQRFRWLPPSSSAMLLGIGAGVASRIAGLAQPLRFSPAAFFYALLPPIVFQAGFALKKKVRAYGQREAGRRAARRQGRGKRLARRRGTRRSRTQPAPSQGSPHAADRRAVLCWSPTVKL